MNAPRVLRFSVLLVGVIAWPVIQAVGEEDGDEIRFGGFNLREAPLAFQAQFAPKTGRVRVASRRLWPEIRSEQWPAIVDRTWGTGLNTKEKLRIFDQFWTSIDTSFVCFGGIDVDWRGLRARYRPEVEDGVSRGRFAAIMSRLSLALMDAHTAAVDTLVQWRTSSTPGTPLLHVGGWGLDTHFGAGLTPLPDKSLLVYNTVPAHPLGLEPGDIILGYDGRPWSELYPELLELGLPVTGLWGSSQSTYEHAWLMAAGLNWHLFDTIDVKKYGAGEVLHLPTRPMVGYDEELWVSEQVPVDGVSFPDVDNGQLISWGLIEGTRIGYIYGWGWFWDAELEFHEAVHRLMYEQDTEGLIIDLRFSSGGDMLCGNRALALLFDHTVDTIDLVRRCESDNHSRLCTLNNASSYAIPGNPSSFYNRPIAVLIGPGAVGCGEQVALRLAFHPNARIFGKSTNSAFSSLASAELAEDWNAGFADTAAFLLSAAAEPPLFGYRLSVHNEEGIVPELENWIIVGDGFLPHSEFSVDYPVWLTPEDAAAGRDTVVEAAVQWITTPRE